MVRRGGRKSAALTVSPPPAFVAPVLLGAEIRRVVLLAAFVEPVLTRPVRLDDVVAFVGRRFVELLLEPRVRTLAMLSLRVLLRSFLDAVLVLRHSYLLRGRQRYGQWSGHDGRTVEAVIPGEQSESRNPHVSPA